MYLVVSNPNPARFILFNWLCFWSFSFSFAVWNWYSTIDKCDVFAQWRQWNSQYIKKSYKVIAIGINYKRVKKYRFFFFFFHSVAFFILWCFRVFFSACYVIYLFSFSFFFHSLDALIIFVHIKFCVAVGCCGFSHCATIDDLWLMDACIQRFHFSRHDERQHNVRFNMI